MTAIPVDQAAELLQAIIRHAMVEHAAIQPRGFDSIRRRNQIHREIDELLDRYLVMVAAE